MPGTLSLGICSTKSVKLSRVIFQSVVFKYCCVLNLPHYNVCVYIYSVDGRRCKEIHVSNAWTSMVLVSRANRAIQDLVREFPQVD